MTELFPCLLFIGLGAMIDFGPMLANPVVLIFGAAGQFGIFLTLLLALALGFARGQAVAIAIIGACDGPTAIYVASKFAIELLPAVSIAAYSYMSLVPIIQPPIMRALTTKKERATLMATGEKKVSKTVKLLFPLVAGILTILIAPMGAPLMGMLMLGNFIKESGVIGRLVDVSQHTLTNMVTLFLGLSIGASMLGGNFLKWQTIVVFALDFCYRFGYCRWSSAGEIDASYQQRQNQSSAGRRGYFCFPDVGQSSTKGRAKSQPSQLPVIQCYRR